LVAVAKGEATARKGKAVEEEEQRATTTTTTTKDDAGEVRG
jgi:hypothetical protein